jgi:TRAP-type C4-dicarboxylate transport system permease small subunit
MRRAIDRTLETLLALIMFIMVLSVLWQVFSRYILQDPSSFTEELVRFLLIWVGILGAAYASGKRLHLAIDLLPSKLAPVQRVSLQRIIDSLILLFAIAVFIIGGGRLVYITFILEQNSPALQLPLAYVYTVLPLSGLIIVFYKIQSLVKPESNGVR